MPLPGLWPTHPPTACALRRAQQQLRIAHLILIPPRAFAAADALRLQQLLNQLILLRVVGVQRALAAGQQHLQAGGALVGADGCEHRSLQGLQVSHNPSLSCGVSWVSQEQYVLPGTPSGGGKL